MARQTATVVSVEQLDLFGGFVASAVQTIKRQRASRPAANEPVYVQPALAPEEDQPALLPRLVLDDEDDDYPVHRLTSASQCEVPKDLGPASIFAAGAAYACTALRPASWAASGRADMLSYPRRPGLKR
jgi:hypothetical protein